METREGYKFEINDLKLNLVLQPNVKRLRFS